MAEQVTSKDKIGLVVSDKMQKTIVVRVDRRVQHPRYKRVITRSRKYKVHDEEKTAQRGDYVRIREVRHLSADKYHTLVEVVRRAAVHPDERLKEANLS